MSPTITESDLRRQVARLPWVSLAQLPTPLECGNICEFAINPENPDVILGLEGMG